MHFQYKRLKKLRYSEVQSDWGVYTFDLRLKDCLINHHTPCSDVKRRKNYRKRIRQARAGQRLNEVLYKSH